MTAPILYLGDSLSVGVAGSMLGAAADAGVPVPALELPGKPGGRRAVTVTPAVAREWHALGPHSAVWIELGTNDLLGTAEDIARAWRVYEAMIRDVATWGLPLSLASVPPLRDHEAQAAAWSTATRELARDVGAAYVPIHENFTLSELPDGVHATAAGYRRMGRLWLTARREQSSSGGGGALALAGALALLWLWRRGR